VEIPTGVALPGGMPGSSIEKGNGKQVAMMLGGD